MKYEVLTYGNAALRKKAVPVKKVDDSIRQLAKDMLSTMYLAHGVGLASEQVGRNEALCVIDVPLELDSPEKDGPRDNPHVRMPLALVNPKIIAETGKQSSQEGCLSFPEIFVTLARPYEVTVIFTGLDNRERTETVRGYLARAVLHEMDHLNGILLVDRMSTIQKLTVATKLKRLKKAAKAKPAESR